MKTALVIGGTGPTGPHIVNGLLDRGFEPSILHSGAHEVDFAKDIEHLHADVHFREPFEAALGQRHWDVVVVNYGRLQLACELLRGHTERVVAIGGSTGSLAAPDDPRWGELGRAANLDEAGGLPEVDPARNKLGVKMAEAERALFRAHDAGHFNATQIAYPIVYGPRQPGAQDWCIVRRALDRRRHFIVADGGIKRRFGDTAKIRRKLGYRDVVGTLDALKQSVAWLLENRALAGGELEQQLGDPFDYAREDALIAQWLAARAQMPQVDYPLPAAAHIYRHPRQADEPWRRPS